MKYVRARDPTLKCFCFGGLARGDVVVKACQKGQ